MVPALRGQTCTGIANIQLLPQASGLQRSDCIGTRQYISAGEYLHT